MIFSSKFIRQQFTYLALEFHDSSVDRTCCPTPYTCRTFEAERIFVIIIKIVCCLMGAFCPWRKRNNMSYYVRPSTFILFIVIVGINF